MQIIVRDEVKVYLNKKTSKVLTLSLVRTGGG